MFFFDVITVADAGLVVGVVPVAAAGRAVSFQEVCLVATGTAAADVVTQHAVGGAS